MVPQVRSSLTIIHQVRNRRPCSAAWPPGSSALWLSALTDLPGPAVLTPERRNKTDFTLNVRTRSFVTVCPAPPCVSESAGTFVSERRAADGVSPSGQHARPGDALCPPAGWTASAPSEQTPGKHADNLYFCEETHVI